ncbi:MAG: hypothetical protein IIY78_01610, partial [Clostridia bacterium]|nr:hypothetical protein [Clostridia bacterium]
DKGAGIPSGYSVAIRCQGGNQSVRFKCGRVGHSSTSNIRNAQNQLLWFVYMYPYVSGEFTPSECHIKHE